MVVEWPFKLLLHSFDAAAFCKCWDNMHVLLLQAELQHWRLDTASGLLTREHKSDMTPRHDDEGDVTSSQEHMSISAAGGV